MGKGKCGNESVCQWVADTKISCKELKRPQMASTKATLKRLIGKWKFSKWKLFCYKNESSTKFSILSKVGSKVHQSEAELKGCEKKNQMMKRT